ncbi:putative coiled-coil domain-containing protein 195 [Apus apus]|uniref:putative coiled-coil domain-containing protein 195 n=1 Tax=Apus apus TaxID=8895 RepID=UPI0021F81AEB|nr:putative coiled-coil domain-containing protein 195 [Apus apus]
MEGNTHLLQVIRKMRSQINKLESENRALRGELQVCVQRAGPLEKEAARGGGSIVRSLSSDGEGPAGSPALLPESSVAGPVPAPKQRTVTTMTVRRYSTASPVPAAPSARSHQHVSRILGPTRAPGRALPPAPPSAAQLTNGEDRRLEETAANCLSYSNSSKTKLLQEHVCKCRGKVKAVSFLLPMDMSSYGDKQGCLKSPQNQSTKQLTTIAEKDM